MTEEHKPMAWRCSFAQWRDGVVWLSHFPKWPLRRMAFVLVSMIAFCGFVAEASVPLTVKCRFDRANDQSDIGSKSDLLWVFVLDHSGSMDGRDATSVKTGRRVTRWEALKDSFEETVKSISIGSVVQFYCVDGPKYSKAKPVRRSYPDP